MLKHRGFFLAVALCVLSTLQATAAGAGGATADADQVPSAPIECPVCVEGCVPGQTCYTLVLRYTVNLAPPMQAPLLESRETFTEENFPTIDDAFCFARKIRRDGYVVPTLMFVNPSNVMPDTITPMPVL